eukprot:5316864-Amphidinium_carterae.1
MSLQQAVCTQQCVSFQALKTVERSSDHLTFSTGSHEVVMSSCHLADDVVPQEDTLHNCKTQ